MKRYITIKTIEDELLASLDTETGETIIKNGIEVTTSDAEERFYRHEGMLDHTRVVEGFQTGCLTKGSH